MKTARLVGGPRHGEILQVEDRMGEIRVMNPVTPERLRYAYSKSTVPVALEPDITVYREERFGISLDETTQGETTLFMAPGARLSDGVRAYGFGIFEVGPRWD